MRHPRFPGNNNPNFMPNSSLLQGNTGFFQAQQLRGGPPRNAVPGFHHFGPHPVHVQPSLFNNTRFSLGQSNVPRHWAAMSHQSSSRMPMPTVSGRSCRRGQKPAFPIKRTSCLKIEHKNVEVPRSSAPNEEKNSTQLESKKSATVDSGHVDSSFENQFEGFENSPDIKRTSLELKLVRKECNLKKTIKLKQTSKLPLKKTKSKGRCKIHSHRPIPWPEKVIKQEIEETDAESSLNVSCKDSPLESNLLTKESLMEAPKTSLEIKKPEIASLNPNSPKINLLTRSKKRKIELIRPSFSGTSKIKKEKLGDIPSAILSTEATDFSLKVGCTNAASSDHSKTDSLSSSSTQSYSNIQTISTLSPSFNIINESCVNLVASDMACMHTSSLSTSEMASASLELDSSLPINSKEFQQTETLDSSAADALPIMSEEIEKSVENLFEDCMGEPALQEDAMLFAPSDSFFDMIFGDLSQCVELQLVNFFPLLSSAQIIKIFGFCGKVLNWEDCDGNELQPNAGLSVVCLQGSFAAGLAVEVLNGAMLGMTKLSVTPRNDSASTALLALPPEVLHSDVTVQCLQSIQTFLVNEGFQSFTPPPAYSHLKSNSSGLISSLPLIESLDASTPLPQTSCTSELPMVVSDACALVGGESSTSSSVAPLGSVAENVFVATSSSNSEIGSHINNDEGKLVIPAPTNSITSEDVNPTFGSSKTMPAIPPSSNESVSAFVDNTVTPVATVTSISDDHCSVLVNRKSTLGSANPRKRKNPRSRMCRKKTKPAAKKDELQENCGVVTRRKTRSMAKCLTKVSDSSSLEPITEQDIGDQSLASIIGLCETMQQGDDLVQTPVVNNEIVANQNEHIAMDTPCSSSVECIAASSNLSTTCTSLEQTAPSKNKLIDETTRCLERNSTSHISEDVTKIIYQSRESDEVPLAVTEKLPPILENAVTNSDLSVEKYSTGMDVQNFTDMSVTLESSVPTSVAETIPCLPNVTTSELSNNSTSQNSLTNIVSSNADNIQSLQRLPTQGTSNPIAEVDIKPDLKVLQRNLMIASKKGTSIRNNKNIEGGSKKIFEDGSNSNIEGGSKRNIEDGRNQNNEDTGTNLQAESDFSSVRIKSEPVDSCEESCLPGFDFGDALGEDRKPLMSSESTADDAARLVDSFGDQISALLPPISKFENIEPSAIKEEPRSVPVVELENVDDSFNESFQDDDYTFDECFSSLSAREGESYRTTTAPDTLPTSQVSVTNSVPDRVNENDSNTLLVSSNCPATDVSPEASGRVLHGLGKTSAAIRSSAPCSTSATSIISPIPIASPTIQPEFSLTESHTPPPEVQINLLKFKKVLCPDQSSCRLPSCSYFHDETDFIRDYRTYRGIKCRNVFQHFQHRWRDVKCCNQGIHCKFAHNQLEFLFHPTNYKRYLCCSLAHSPGSCPYRDNCAFRHTENDVSRDEVFRRQEEFLKQRSGRAEESGRRASNDTLSPNLQQPSLNTQTTGSGNCQPCEVSDTNRLEVSQSCEIEATRAGTLSQIMPKLSANATFMSQKGSSSSNVEEFRHNLLNKNVTPVQRTPNEETRATVVKSERTSCEREITPTLDIEADYAAYKANIVTSDECKEITPLERHVQNEYPAIPSLAGALVGLKVVENLKMLSEFNFHFGVVGAVLPIIHRKASELLKRGGNPLSVFNDSDNIALLSLLKQKITKLEGSVDDARIDQMKRSLFELTIEVENSTNIERDDHLGLDINALARSTLDFTAQQISRFITNVLICEGKPSVPSHLIQAIGTAVAGKHFKMARGSGCPELPVSVGRICNKPNRHGLPPLPTKPFDRLHDQRKVASVTPSVVISKSGVGDITAGSANSSNARSDVPLHRSTRNPRIAVSVDAERRESSEGDMNFNRRSESWSENNRECNQTLYIRGDAGERSSHRLPGARANVFAPRNTYSDHNNLPDLSSDAFSERNHHLASSNDAVRQARSSSRLSDNKGDVDLRRLPAHTLDTFNIRIPEAFGPGSPADDEMVAAMNLDIDQDMRQPRPDASKDDMNHDRKCDETTSRRISIESETRDQKQIFIWASESFRENRDHEIAPDEFEDEFKPLNSIDPRPCHSQGPPDNRHFDADLDRVSRVNRLFCPTNDGFQSQIKCSDIPLKPIRKNERSAVGPRPTAEPWLGDRARRPATTPVLPGHANLSDQPYVQRVPKESQPTFKGPQPSDILPLLLSETSPRNSRSPLLTKNPPPILTPPSGNSGSHNSGNFEPLNNPSVASSSIIPQSFIENPQICKPNVPPINMRHPSPGLVQTFVPSGIPPKNHAGFVPKGSNSHLQHNVPMRKIQAIKMENNDGGSVPARLTTGGSPVKERWLQLSNLTPLASQPGSCQVTKHINSPPSYGAGRTAIASVNSSFPGSLKRTITSRSFNSPALKDQASSCQRSPGPLLCSSGPPGGTRSHLPFLSTDEPMPVLPVVNSRQVMEISQISNDSTICVPSSQNVYGRESFVNKFGSSTHSTNFQNRAQEVDIVPSAVKLVQNNHKNIADEFSSDDVDKFSRQLLRPPGKFNASGKSPVPNNASALGQSAHAGQFGCASSNFESQTLDQSLGIATAVRPTENTTLFKTKVSPHKLPIEPANTPIRGLPPPSSFTELLTTSKEFPGNLLVATMKTATPDARSASQESLTSTNLQSRTCASAPPSSNRWERSPEDRLNTNATKTPTCQGVQMSTKSPRPRSPRSSIDTRAQKTPTSCTSSSHGSSNDSFIAPPTISERNSVSPEDNFVTPSTMFNTPSTSRPQHTVNRKEWKPPEVAATPPPSPWQSLSLRSDSLYMPSPVRTSASDLNKGPTHIYQFLHKPASLTRPKTSEPCVSKETATTSASASKKAPLKNTASTSSASGSSEFSLNFPGFNMFPEAPVFVTKKNTTMIGSNSECKSQGLGAASSECAKKKIESTPSSSGVTSRKIKSEVEDTFSLPEENKDDDDDVPYSPASRYSDNSDDERHVVVGKTDPEPAEKEVRDVTEMHESPDRDVSLEFEDMVELLRNFTSLDPEEQVAFSTYLRNLKVRDPKQIEKLYSRAKMNE